jgi:hypothetical protein
MRVNIKNLKLTISSENVVELQGEINQNNNEYSAYNYKECEACISFLIQRVSN